MTRINPKTIYTIAKKEFMDNVRNKWIIVLTVIFVLLIIIFSYVGGAGSFGNMQITTLGLLIVTSLLIPLIAIILGYATIAGEAQSGALYVVLSYPVKRIEVLLGKFIGLGSVLILSIFLGFGVGGLFIAGIVGAEALSGYIGSIFLSIFIGLLYLSCIICISAYCKRRSRAIAGGIILIFWGMIYGSVLMGALYGAGYDFNDFYTGNVPEWFFNSVVFSPQDLHQVAVMRAFGINNISMDMFGQQLEFAIPEFLNMGMILFAHLIWVIVPFLLAIYFFNRRDI